MTPHFRLLSDSLSCRCGCGMLPKQDFMDKMEILRVRLGFPLPVTSAARCASHNVKVSATGASGPHTTGRAIDLQVSGARALETVRMALDMGFTGIGVKQHGPHADRFIHLDMLSNAEGQPRPFIWSYA